MKKIPEKMSSLSLELLDVIIQGGGTEDCNLAKFEKSRRESLISPPTKVRIRAGGDRFELIAMINTDSAEQAHTLLLQEVDGLGPIPLFELHPSHPQVESISIHLKNFEESVIKNMYVDDAVLEVLIK